MPTYEFDQRDCGAVMPEHASTVEGTCTQCGREGPIARVALVGMGEHQQVRPCRECVWDIAAGTQVVPVHAFVMTHSGQAAKLLWRDGKPVIEELPRDPVQDEAEALARELVGMAASDPNVNNEFARCWLSEEQRPRSIEIGKRLHELGGFDLMLMVHGAVAQAIQESGRVDNVPGLVRGLEMAWSGIGEWEG